MGALWGSKYNQKSSEILDAILEVKKCVLEGSVKPKSIAGGGELSRYMAGGGPYYRQICQNAQARTARAKPSRRHTTTGQM